MPLTRPATNDPFDSGPTKSSVLIDSIEDLIEDAATGHSHTGAASGGKKVNHTDLLAIGNDDHHPKSHVHLADGSGTVAHSSLSGLTTGDPHTQYALDTDLGLYVPLSTVTTKGDLLVATGSGVIVRRGVGTNGQVLTADSAQADGVKWAAAGAGGGPSVLDRSAADNQIVNTVAETTLYSFAIPGNTIGATGVLRLRILSDYLNNSAGNTTLQIRIKLGATTLWDSGASNNLALSANRRGLNIDVLLANSATNAQRLGGTIFLGAGAATAGVGGLNGTIITSAMLYGTAAEDTTAARTILVSVQHGNANASIEVVRRVVVLELLP